MCPYDGILLSHKKERDSCYNMGELEEVMLHERSGMQRATGMIPFLWHVQNG